MKPQRFQFSIIEIPSPKKVDGKYVNKFYIEGPEVGQKGMRFDTIDQADKWLHHKIKTRGTQSS
jgi:hypothetical protein